MLLSIVGDPFNYRSGASDNPLSFLRVPQFKGGSQNVAGSEIEFLVSPYAVVFHVFCREVLCFYEGFAAVEVFPRVELQPSFLLA